MTVVGGAYLTTKSSVAAAYVASHRVSDLSQLIAYQNVDLLVHLDVGYIYRMCSNITSFSFLTHPRPSSMADRAV